MKKVKFNQRYVNATAGEIREMRSELADKLIAKGIAVEYSAAPVAVKEISHDGLATKEEKVSSRKKK